MDIKRSALVPHSQANMFALVNDIAAYADFVPWCSESIILKQTPDEINARLTFAKSGFHKSFTTRNLLQPNKMMTIRLVEGPFKYLEGFWQFDAKGDEACEVTLTLSFEFSSALSSMVFGPIFNQVANKLVDTFCKRADQVYNK